MPFVLLSLAAVALVAGLIVLWLDQRQRATLSADENVADEPTAAADTAASELTADSPAEPALAEDPEPAPEPDIITEAESEEEDE